MKTGVFSVCCEILDVDVDVDVDMEIGLWNCKVTGNF